MARHRDMLPPPRQRGTGPMDPALAIGLAKIADADTLDAAAATLTRTEIAAVLGNRDALQALERLAE